MDRNIQGYTLTDLGKELLEAPISAQFYRGKRILTEEEKGVFRKALLTSIPVNRVLNLFEEDMIGRSKWVIKV